MDGRPLDLTAREFAFLAYLAKHPNKVCTHRMILEHVWGPRYGTENHYLRVYAYRLRRKLGDPDGEFLRTLPDDQSQASIVAGLLPAGARYVKAFGTLSADSLVASANREPRRAVLFYATDDDDASTTIERLIRATGFDPLKIGGLAEAGRIEMPGGDLHQAGLNGALLDLDEARAAL